FAQAVGRFVRARRRGETASVFLPSIPSLLGYAAEMEAERDHVLSRPGGAEDDERELDAAQRQQDTPDQLEQGPFQALEASAHFDRVLYDGNEFGVTAEEEDFIGLPGLLEPEQVAVLLRARKSAQLSSRPAVPAVAAAGSAPAPAEPTTREVLAVLRK